MRHHATRRPVQSELVRGRYREGLPAPHRRCADGAIPAAGAEGTSAMSFLTRWNWMLPVGSGLLGARAGAFTGVNNARIVEFPGGSEASSTWPSSRDPTDRGSITRRYAEPSLGAMVRCA